MRYARWPESRPMLLHSGSWRLVATLDSSSRISE